MSWALKGSRFASSEPAGIEMMKGWTCESPNAGTSREADGDETGGEERQEYQAEGRGRGPPWEKAGSLRVLELDPVEGASEHTVQAGGGDFRHVSPSTWLCLEYPRETGLILRCTGKGGNPFKTKPGNRPSCRDQEGRRGPDAVVPGTSVFSSSQTGVSQNF